MLDIQTRFKDAPFFKPDLEVIIAGLGGIGSNLSYSLCRQGYTMYLYDMDTIEIHNVGSQMYGIKDIGKNKAEKAKEIAALYGNTSIYTMGEFTEDSPVGNIVFACFDNMKARKLLFEKWSEYQLSKTPEYRIENPTEINIFLDGRMTANDLQIFTVKSKQEIEAYKKTLFDDSEVEALPCSYKATCHTGMMIGSLMSTIFLNHVSNKLSQIMFREVPFATTFSNELMDFKTYNYLEWKE